MKITFKTMPCNRVASDNTAFLSQQIISEDGLNTGLEIAKAQFQSIFDLLDHKRLFISLPVNGKMQPCYAFVIRRADGHICVYSNTYLEIEDGDAIFTTKAECQVLCDEQNGVSEKRENIQARLAHLSVINEKITELMDMLDEDDQDDLGLMSDMAETKNDVELEIMDLMEELDSLNGITVVE